MYEIIRLNTCHCGLARNDTIFFVSLVALHSKQDTYFTVIYCKLIDFDNKKLLYLWLRWFILNFAFVYTNKLS